MRWYVHGSDPATSRSVTLTIDAPEAAAAIHAAMAKNILVTRVTKTPRHRLLAACLSVAVAAILMLACLAALFRWQDSQTQQQLAGAQSEEGRLAAALTETGGIITNLQRRTAALEQAQGGAAKRLVDQLDAANGQTQSLTTQLAASHVAAAKLEAHVADLQNQIASLEPLRQQLAQAQQQFAQSKTQSAQIQAQLQSQVAAAGRHIAALQKSLAATVGMRNTNHDLLAENDLLKNQLLEQTAKSLAVSVAQPIDPPAPPPHPLRWSLITPYDAATDFVALHFDKNPPSVSLTADGAQIATSLLATNAASIRLLADPVKKRLYSATLSLSLNPGAPKEILTANQQLLDDFLHRFAPGFKTPRPWLADVIKQLANKDITDRAVRLGDDYKLTVWNNRLGLYSFKIESPRGDLDG